MGAAKTSQFYVPQLPSRTLQLISASLAVRLWRSPSPPASLPLPVSVYPTGTSSRGFDFLVGLDAASESGRRRHLRRSSDWRHCSFADSVLGRDCEARIHRPGADCLIFYLLWKEFSVVTGPQLVWWQKRERKEKVKSEY